MAITLVNNHCYQFSCPSADVVWKEVICSRVVVHHNSGCLFDINIMTKAGGISVLKSNEKRPLSRNEEIQQSGNKSVSPFYSIEL